MMKTFAVATALLGFATTACAQAPRPTTPAAQAPAAAAPAEKSEFEAVRDEIWAMELAIYEGRGRGDMTAYLSSTAKGFSAWPPHYFEPKGNEGLEQIQTDIRGLSKERLEMTFTSMVLNGDTAIIYYKTHRTSQADGSPADQRYDVTHTWIREDGKWKVLGGMARLRSDGLAGK